MLAFRRKFQNELSNAAKRFELISMGSSPVMLVVCSTVQASPGQ